ncbi:MAG: tetratricopeptide repeat protein [Proteobacteria bacterium]|nr:tetratricopeptide repeat protein [Pseudomonadota bacterium]
MPPMHHATIARQPDPIAPPVTTTAQEVAFDQGWDALRRGDYGPAAAAFGRAIALAPDGALSEDATFWHAVSLARLQRTTDAIAALRAFLDAFPTSTRADEASAMLGWLLVDTHEYFEARRRFEVAKNGLSPAVRESAVKGLAALPTAR